MVSSEVIKGGISMVDVYAHVLTPNYLAEILKIAPNALKNNEWMQNPLLTDIKRRVKTMTEDQQEIISMVNLNPEDWVAPNLAASLCQSANAELIERVEAQPKHFVGTVAMLPMNNIPAALSIIDHQVANNKALVGVQLFTRAMKKPITDPKYEPIFEKMAGLGKPIWLHPVFDERKSDNNLTFSWEYEQTIAMNNIVNNGYFEKYPNLKIIVHHAGAMVPYFAQRIYYIQGKHNYEDFKKFYVDTALLGNPKALEMAVEFFGERHVLFGTDTPLGVKPDGPTQIIKQAIQTSSLTKQQKRKIFVENWQDLIINKLKG
ncbi:amidohydrolase [Pediococcus acidilactici]|uniref:amidohydrolase family protein n=2 Tax=Pediococcus acidilactici TaxID=1254 RepID=UPI0009B91F9F|nr:amidohydrolase family protein [Pediococcus acidilactici]KAF0494715.1 amidohydrolase family protein [Pediococcus acidilactici]MWB54134.1 amidohydrolase family protein [Pediococcus acidilactici]QAR71820.1 amidohydrolase [Pediococcus acidilactici]